MDKILTEIPLYIARDYPPTIEEIQEFAEDMQMMMRKHTWIAGWNTQFERMHN